MYQFCSTLDMYNITYYVAWEVVLLQHCIWRQQCVQLSLIEYNIFSSRKYIISNVENTEEYTEGQNLL